MDQIVVDVELAQRLLGDGHEGARAAQEEIRRDVAANMSSDCVAIQKAVHVVERMDDSQATAVSANQLVRIGSIAVSKAQDESRRLGVPNVYSINGRLYYETPSGELSTTDPYADGNNATEQSHAAEP